MFFKCFISTFAIFFSCYGIDPLPSWNDGLAKKAIMEFVIKTTAKESLTYVPLEERIATFDQDGTLWVEQPIYTQLIYCFDRLPLVIAEKPELRNEEPFKTILSEGRRALENLSMQDFEKIAIATLTGMTIEQFKREVLQWITTAKNERWKRLYTELTYKPMQEVLTYLRENGYRTYIVTGGGQDFVRAYSEETYGIPPENVIGTAAGVKFEYDKNGKPYLEKDPRLLLNDNFAGKPEAIHLMIGQRPTFAFGNSTGDREMLEYTQAASGIRLSMLILHDDPNREYAYGPAQGLPDTKVGVFTQKLYDEAKRNGWTIVSMKNDWKRIFAFEQ